MAERINLNSLNNFTDISSEDLSKIILVTGGAGFIGSNFIRYLMGKYSKYKIINFDKLTYAGNLNNLSSIEENPNYVFVKGDVADNRDVKNVFEEFNPNYIVHFAAESHVDRSILNPDIFLKTNILGTQILLNQARENSVEKFVHISTDEVYGSLEIPISCDENRKIAPNNPYAASKASADLLVRVAHQTFGQFVNIIRCCNNYGPFQFPEKFIPIIIWNTLKNTEIPIYGDGKNIRDWIHVDDHCKAIDLVLHKGKSGEIYNVGANNEWQNLKLVEFILDELYASKNLIEFVEDRKGHDFRYSIDSSKIKEELGWKSSIDFNDGLKQTINWYKSHLDWIEEIHSGEYLDYYDKIYKDRLLETS